MAGWFEETKVHKNDVILQFESQLQLCSLSVVETVQIVNHNVLLCNRLIKTTDSKVHKLLCEMPVCRIKCFSWNRNCYNYYYFFFFILPAVSSGRGHYFLPQTPQVFDDKSFWHEHQVLPHRSFIRYYVCPSYLSVRFSINRHCGEIIVGVEI